MAKEVFVAACNPVDKDVIFTHLKYKGFYPVFYEDKYEYRDVEQTEQYAVQRYYLFDQACTGAKESGALAVPKAFENEQYIIQLINWCVNENIPVYVFDEQFNNTRPGLWLK